MVRRRSRSKKPAAERTTDGDSSTISGGGARELRTLPSALSTQRLARSQSKITELLDHAHQHVELAVRICDGEDASDDWPSMVDTARSQDSTGGPFASKSKTALLVRVLLRKKQRVVRLADLSRKSSHEDARFQRLQHGYTVVTQHLSDTNASRESLATALMTFRKRAKALESVLPPEPPRDSRVMTTSLHACFAQTSDLVDDVVNVLAHDVAVQTQSKIHQLETFKQTLERRERLQLDTEIAKQQLDQFQKLKVKQRSPIPGAYELELAQRKQEYHAQRRRLVAMTAAMEHVFQFHTHLDQCIVDPEIATPSQAAPAHSRPPCSQEDVLWLWKGALTSQSITFKFGLRDGHKCRDRDFILHAFPELVSDSEKPHSTLAMCTSITENDEFAQAKICELNHLSFPDRTYNYVLSFVPSEKSVLNAVVKRGTFRTPATEGTPFNFKFAFSSCADEDSDPQVFHEIQQEKTLFFLHMGDLHYHNIDVDDVAKFRNAYHSLFGSPSGRALLEMELPFAYMWDDHDYGPDNSDKTAPGRNASLQVYREFVPHYPLAAGDKDPQAAVYQAFTIGRVRFILTDLRSQRTPNLSPDKPSKTVLGATQKKWFKEELVVATNDPQIALIVWCSTMPWHDDERKWGYFQYEQQELTNYMKGHGVNKWKKVVIVSGDAHMLAVDDGRHTPGNMTLFHAAALGRPGSVKGGPYSHGAFPGTGQYGVMDVVDDGTKVCLHFKGVRMGQGTLVEYDTCHPEKTPSKGGYYPPPIPIRQLTRAWRKFKKHAFGMAGMGVAMGFVLVLGVAKYLKGRAATRTKKNR